MHLRAASMAMVVCGLMIGTLAAQYAQQGRANAQQVGAPSSSPDRANASSQDRRRFSLWDALSGRRSSGQTNNSHGPAGSNQRPPEQTNQYFGNRPYTQPQTDNTAQQDRTPVSQFGPPTAETGRRALSTAAPEQTGESRDDLSSTDAAAAQPRSTPADADDSAQYQPAPTQPGGYSPTPQEYQAAPRSRGLMSPLLDMFGNRHQVPQNQPPQFQPPQYQQQPYQQPQYQSAPRANSAFGGQPIGRTNQSEPKSKSLIPDMILNGRPGPLPMMPQGVGEPELADSSESNNQIQPVPSPAPQMPVRSWPVPFQQRTQPQQQVQQQPVLPRTMASAEIRSPRLGPSAAEQGFAPPQPAEIVDNSKTTDLPSNSILSDQPLVRVKEPKRQSNAVVKSLADRLGQREAANAAEPETAEDWLNRGKTLAIELNFVEAINAYTKAVQLDPYNLEAYGNRGLAYRQREMYREAVYDFNIVLRLSPDMSKAYYDRAETYRMAGKLEKAARDYEEAIRLDPEFALAHAQYGAMLMRNGEYEDAAEILDVAVALNKDDELSIYDRGLAAAMSGDFQSALHDLERISDAASGSSKWESLLTRLRRTGEPMTTVDMPERAAEALADASPAASEPAVDLSADPFFGGSAKSGTAIAASPRASVSQDGPSSVPHRNLVEPKRLAPAEDSTPTASSLTQVDKPQAERVQTPTAREADPQPTEVASSPETDAAAEEEKPLRIVLGGGSTKLKHENKTFVRVAEPETQSAKRGDVSYETTKPSPQIARTEKPEPKKPVSQLKLEPKPQPIASAPVEVENHDADSLWTTSRQNRAVSRAARRGDGTLFTIITRDESALNPVEETDPFAVISTPSSSNGIAHVVRPLDEEKTQSEPIAKENTAKTTFDVGEPLEFDGIQLPDPAQLTTLSQVDAAIDQYNEAILRRPRFAPYYVARAKLWLKQERRTAALTDLRQAVRLDGQLAEAKSAKEKLESEIADDLARQQQTLRTAGRDTSGWGQSSRRK